MMPVVSVSIFVFVSSAYISLESDGSTRTLNEYTSASTETGDAFHESAGMHSVSDSYLGGISIPPAAEMIAKHLVRVKKLRAALDTGFVIITGPSSTGKTEHLELAVPEAERTTFNLKPTFLATLYPTKIPNDVWRNDYYTEAIKQKELNWLSANEPAIVRNIISQNRDVIVLDEFDLMMTPAMDDVQKDICQKIIDMAQTLKSAGKKVVLVAHEAFLNDQDIMSYTETQLRINDIKTNNVVVTGYFTKNEEKAILQAAGFRRNDIKFIQRHANGVAAVYIDLITESLKDKSEKLKDKNFFFERAKARVSRLAALTGVEPDLIKTVERTTVLSPEFAIENLPSVRKDR